MDPLGCYASPKYRPVGLVPVRILGTDHCDLVSDRSDPITLVIRVITVSTKDYVVYNRGLSTPLWLLILNT